MPPDTTHLLTWIIALLATAGVIIRPWRLPEAVWACGGALLLVVSGLLSPLLAWQAWLRGLDVYLFLIGMMVLADLARREGVFEWLAAIAVGHANGSARRLFVLVYLIGIVVTVFLSNDATAVVLTPAVYAVARRARADPLPYLFACAFIANAASFVLPISNPANLVVFGERMPPLRAWLAAFALPSLAAITVTFLLLAVRFRKPLAATLQQPRDTVTLQRGGRIALGGIVLVAVALVIVSALHLPLGWATCSFAAAVTTAVLVGKRESPRALLGEVSWSVLALVGGLFVIVGALQATGVISELGRLMESTASARPAQAAWGWALAIAAACNLMNNLPAGLIAGTAAGTADIPEHLRHAIVIAIDLGPNLSVTGSLATILWLIALRREGEHVSAWDFLRLGAVVMPLSLVAALICLLLQ